jgi:hypothetical protein
MKRVIAAALPLAVVVLTGCSQAAQLQPVAGGQISAVRTATNDVLVDRGVDIHVAPVCEFSEPQFVCIGSTAKGEEIRSQARVVAKFGATQTEYGADSPADVSLVVTVAGDTIYEGNVEDVLIDNGRAAP